MSFVTDHLTLTKGPWTDVILFYDNQAQVCFAYLQVIHQLHSDDTFAGTLLE